MTDAPTPPAQSMNRQAREILSLLEAKAQADGRSLEEAIAERSKCRSLVISSGSGGVGRSLLALQTALALGAHGLPVALLDANGGVSHTALLAGVSDWKSLDELGSDGSPDDVAITINRNVRLVCGMADWLGDGLTDERATLLDEWLDDRTWCVIDAGPRTQSGVMRLLEQADVPVLVTTPEPVPLAETYAALRALQKAGRSDVSVVLNRVRSADVGRRVGKFLSETAGRFLDQPLALATMLIDEDPVAQAAQSRRAGQLLKDTNFGRAVSSWTSRLQRAA